MTSVILKELATLVFIVWGIRQGFLARPGVFLSWPMFSRMAAYRVNLRCERTGDRIVPWRYMLHPDYFGGPRTLQDFLEYLEEQHSTVVSGLGVIADPNGYTEVEVQHSRVVSR